MFDATESVVAIWKFDTMDTILSYRLSSENDAWSSSGALATLTLPLCSKLKKIEIVRDAPLLCGGIQMIRAAKNFLA